MTDFDYDLSCVYDYDILKDLVRNVCLSDKMQKQIIEKYLCEDMDNKTEYLFCCMANNPSLNRESQLSLSENEELYIELAKNPSLIQEVQIKLIDFLLETQTKRPLVRTEFLNCLIDIPLCEEAQLKLYSVLDNDYVFAMMGNCGLCERLQKIFLEKKFDLYKLAQLPNLCEEVQRGLLELKDNRIYRALMCNPGLHSSIQDEMNIELILIKHSS